MKKPDPVDGIRTIAEHEAEEELTRAELRGESDRRIKKLADALLALRAERLAAEAADQPQLPTRRDSR